MLLDGTEPQEIIQESNGAQSQLISSQSGLVVGGLSDHVEGQLWSLVGSRGWTDTVKGTCKLCRSLDDAGLYSLSQNKIYC